VCVCECVEFDFRMFVGPYDCLPVRVFKREKQTGELLKIIFSAWCNNLQFLHSTHIFCLSILQCGKKTIVIQNADNQKRITHHNDLAESMPFLFFS